MSLVRLCIAWIARGEEFVLSALLLAMIGLACLQIGLRLFFSSGLSWADPLLRYLVLWAGLLGASVATRQKKHIAIDIATHLMPPAVLSWLHIVMHLFSMAVCLALTNSAVSFVRDEAMYGGSQTLLGLSSWQLHLIFPVAFGLITLRFFIRAMVGINEALKGMDTRSLPWG